MPQVPISTYSQLNNIEAYVCFRLHALLSVLLLYEVYSFDDVYLTTFIWPIGFKFDWFLMNRFAFLKKTNQQVKPIYIPFAASVRLSYEYKMARFRRDASRPPYEIVKLYAKLQPYRRGPVSQHVQFLDMSTFVASHKSASRLSHVNTLSQ